MDHNEHDIINRIKSDDKKAFEELFFDYYPKLTVFAKKYVRNMDTAKEIVQDFFVRLFESRGKLNIQTSLKSYLYSSVKNSCLNYLNQKKLHASHAENIRIQNKDSVIDFSDTMEQTELEYRIWQEVSGLPDQCKRIFNLSRKEGIKNKEIADQLDISIRTVETQISKALKILRTNLNQYLKIIFL